jgi:hypothetical protein
MKLFPHTDSTDFADKIKTHVLSYFKLFSIPTPFHRFKGFAFGTLIKLTAMAFAGRQASFDILYFEVPSTSTAEQ